MKSGWHGERYRHSMAGRRIRSSNNFRHFNSCGIQSHFATAKTLEKFLNTPEGEEYLERYFYDLYEIPFNDISKNMGIPYWIDNYKNYVTEEYEILKKQEIDNHIIENVSGYYDIYKSGEYREIEGKPYYYAGGLLGSEELELQAENGELVYHNIGSNFFRIWKPFPKTYIELDENDEYRLFDNNKYIWGGTSYDTIKENAENKFKDKMPKMYFDYKQNKFVGE